MLRFGPQPSPGSCIPAAREHEEGWGLHLRNSQVPIAPAEWPLSCLQVETSVRHTMRPLFSDRRHLDASHTHQIRPESRERIS